MWVLEVKPFGPSFHRHAPAGFAPANFLMGSDLDSTHYGAFPKSMCLLGQLRDALARGSPLFPAPASNPALAGFWPHHCLDVSLGWTFPRAEARLNHYATYNENRWRAKCRETNPTFAGLSRDKKEICNDSATGGMEAFFHRMSDHIDLRLFESIDERDPPDYVLSRALPMPTRLQHKLRQYCDERAPALVGAARSLCIQAAAMSHKAALEAASNASERKSIPVCTCMRMLGGASNNGSGVWRATYRCGGGHHGDDGSYCYWHCCRGNLKPNPRKPKW